MATQYGAPLARAWSRMRRMLFRPARLDVWLVLGFAAFLSGLDGGNINLNLPIRGPQGLSRFGDGIEDLLRNPVWIVLLALALVFGLVFLLLLSWVNARGKFIFLENVLHERAAIVEPWKRHRRLGNSLFLWRLVFSLIVLPLFLLAFLPLWPMLQSMLFEDGEFLPSYLASLAVSGMCFALLGIVVVYVQVFLHHFVIPLMYRDDLTTSAAWRRFAVLFRSAPGSFIAYGLLLLVLALATFAAILVAGLATCCCGFVLVALPYVSSVVLLPLWVTHRGFGPEFLAQWGPDWSVFPVPVAAPPEAPPATAPPEPNREEPPTP